MESHCNCNGDSFVSSSSMETVDDLLEECWFFENLFKRRAPNSAMMLRCNTDPCPAAAAAASKMSQNLLPKSSESENSSSTEKKQDGVVHRGLIRVPSLLPCIGRKKENREEKESNDGTNKLTRQSSHQNMLQEPKSSYNEKKQGSHRKESENSSKLSGGQSSRRRLQRAPYLSQNIGREDIIHDKESETRMSRLIQQAFADSSEDPKGIPTLRSSRSSEVLESNNTNGIKEMRRPFLNQPNMMRESLNDLLETDEVQGFKDLGFKFEKTDLRPSVVNVFPDFQEKKREELKQDNNKMRRPYLSEAWRRQSCAIPPVPNWAVKKSAEDMKAQLKFWAQVVASNVRQEC